jgi:hypothetical protein
LAVGLSLPARISLLPTRVRDLTLVAVRAFRVILAADYEQRHLPRCCRCNSRFYISFVVASVCGALPYAEQISCQRLFAVYTVAFSPCALFLYTWCYNLLLVDGVLRAAMAPGACASPIAYKPPFLLAQLSAQRHGAAFRRVTVLFRHHACFCGV